MESKTDGRRTFDLRNSRPQDYDLEGPVQPEMSWLPVSHNKATGQGSYVRRMAPGAVAIAHEHPGYEEFLVLEGELIDGDGARFKAGDFVCYRLGARHNSRAGTGCLLAVFEWRPPAR